jgi:hypothetical protein
MIVVGRITGWRNAFLRRPTGDDVGRTTYFRADSGIILLFFIFQLIINVLSVGIAMGWNANWR